MTDEKSTAEVIADKIAGNRKAIAAICVLIVIVLAGYGLGSNKVNLKNIFKKNITADEAKGKIEALINDSGGEATIKEAVEDGDLYKITVSFNGQDQPVYVTKDGKKFIQQAVDFSEIEKQRDEAKKQEEEAAKPTPKSDKPTVDLYVMSFCPYGNKAEDTIKSVYNLLKTKADFNFHYIVTVDGDKVASLHGQPEVDQNEREACVLSKYGKDQWMNFVTYVNTNCGSDGKCWQSGAKSFGIDTAKISACVGSEGVALMKQNAEASSEASASGSPTLVINGKTAQVVYQYGDSEAYKKAICDAFNTAPAECSKTLVSKAATSASSSAPAQGGSCGGN